MSYSHCFPVSVFESCWVLDTHGTSVDSQVTFQLLHCHMAAVTILDSLSLNVLTDSMQARPRPFWVWGRSEFHQMSRNKVDLCVWKVMKGWFCPTSLKRPFFLQVNILGRSFFVSFLFPLHHLPACALALKMCLQNNWLNILLVSTSLVHSVAFCKSLRLLTPKELKLMARVIGGARSWDPETNFDTELKILFKFIFQITWWLIGLG